MWYDLDLPEFFDKAFCVVALVSTNGDTPGSTRQLFNHGLGRLTFSGTGCHGDAGLDDQAVSVLHQRVSLVAKPGFLGAALAVTSGVTSKGVANDKKI